MTFITSALGSVEEASGAEGGRPPSPPPPFPLAHAPPVAVSTASFSSRVSPSLHSGAVAAHGEEGPRVGEKPSVQCCERGGGAEDAVERPTKEEDDAEEEEDVGRGNGRAESCRVGRKEKRGGDDGSPSSSPTMVELDGKERGGGSGMAVLGETGGGENQTEWVVGEGARSCGGGERPGSVVLHGCVVSFSSPSFLSAAASTWHGGFTVGRRTGSGGERRISSPGFAASSSLVDRPPWLLLSLSCASRDDPFSTVIFGTSPFSCRRRSLFFARAISSASLSSCTIDGCGTLHEVEKVCVTTAEVSSSCRVHQLEFASSPSSESSSFSSYSETRSNPATPSALFRISQSCCCNKKSSRRKRRS